MKNIQRCICGLTPHFRSVPGYKGIIELECTCNRHAPLYPVGETKTECVTAWNALINHLGFLLAKDTLNDD